MKKGRLLVYLIDIILLVIIVILNIKSYCDYKEVKLDHHATSLFDSEMTKQVGKNNKEINNGKNKYVVNHLELDEITVTKQLLDNYIDNYSDYYNFYLDYENYIGPDNIMTLIIHVILENKDDDKIKKFNYYFYYDLENKQFVKETYIFKGDYNKYFHEVISDYINDRSDYFVDTSRAKFNFVLLKNNLYLYVDNLLIDTLTIKVPYTEMYEYMNLDFTDKTKYNTLSKKMYVIENNNVYEKPNKNSNKIGNLFSGEQIYIIGNVGDYSKIVYNNKIAYALSEYLSETESIKYYLDQNDIIYINADDVYLYKTDDEKNENKVNIKKLTPLVRVGISDKWSKVVYNDKIYYVLNKYISNSIYEFSSN